MIWPRFGMAGWAGVDGPVQGLFHEGVLDPVGLATKLQEPAVVHDAVDDRGDHVDVPSIARSTASASLSRCGSSTASYSPEVPSATPCLK